jgi:hypothetical protein
MAASYLDAWNPAAIIAAHTALLALIDGAATAGKITLHKSDDTLLATIPLTDPAGTVNGTTGALTLTASARDESADASGTASYATIRDGNNVAYRSLSCQAGSAAVSNKCVLNTLSIIAGGPVELVSAVIS